MDTNNKTVREVFDDLKAAADKLGLQHKLIDARRVRKTREGFIFQDENDGGVDDDSKSAEDTTQKLHDALTKEIECMEGGAEYDILTIVVRR